MLRIDQRRHGLGAQFSARLDGRAVASWRTGVNWTGARRPLRVTVDGRPCELHSGRGVHELRRDGAVVATCTPARATPWSVTVGSETLALRPAAWGRRELTLEQGDQVLGRIWTSGSMRPMYTAELPEALDAATQVFLVWTARTVWSRRAAAASSAGTIGS